MVEGEEERRMGLTVVETVERGGRRSKRERGRRNGERERKKKRRKGFRRKRRGRDVSGTVINTFSLKIVTTIIKRCQRFVNSLRYFLKRYNEFKTLCNVCL
jgi:hypothetical protein